jgi:hypothetical protein
LGEPCVVRSNNAAPVPNIHPSRSDRDHQQFYQWR